MGTAAEDAGSINRQLGDVISHFTDLQNQVDQGKLTQAQYLQEANNVLPNIDKQLYSWQRIGSNVNSLIGDNSDKFRKLQRTSNMYQAGQDLLGRDLTKNEIAQFTPSFSDPESGKANIAAYAQQEAQKPSNLAKKGGEYSGDVNGVFQELLKRGATQEEVNHFGGMIASGQIDPYQLHQFVQATPEYQTQQDTQFRGGLAKELQGYDQSFFDKSKQSVLSQFAKQGQSFGNSSSLDYALTDLMGKIAENRGKYLAGISAQQYGGNKDAARQDYQATQGNYMDSLNNSRNNTQGLQQYYTQRGNDLTDYNRQLNDYMTMQNNRQKQSPGLYDYLNLGINAVGTGAKAYAAF